MKKAEQVGKIDPKPAVKTAGVYASVHEGVVPLNHHEPFALEALHKSPSRLRSTQPVQDQSHATGKEPAAKYRRAKIDEGIGSSDRMSAFPQITKATLYHEH